MQWLSSTDRAGGTPQPFDKPKARPNFPSEPIQNEKRLDSVVEGQNFVGMKPRRIHAAVSWLMFKPTSATSTCLSLRWSFVALLMIGLHASLDAKAQVLEFIQPTNGAVYSTLDEIPIVLRASAPNDVIFSADVFANFHQKIATAQYCCPLCPCARPLPGQETILQIPGSYRNGMPPLRSWQGWTNVSAGEYELTAMGVGENGTSVTAPPVNITVLDLDLRIYPGAEGGMVLSIAQGAMVRGGYDLQVSEDLQSWTRLGPFSPGNVAAFYWDTPPKDLRVRFYRAVYIPPRTP